MQKSSVQRWIGPLTIGLFLLSSAAFFASAQIPTNQLNCADPLFNASPACRGVVDPSIQTTAPTISSPSNGMDNNHARSSDTQQVYVDSAGLNSSRAPINRDDLFPSDPITDLQRLARAATGEMLPIFGRDLFQRAPSTFAPADQIPVTSDYVIGPGDEVLVRLWGPEAFNSQLTVDTSGSIYIPKVGAIHVAGLRYDELQNQISSEVNHVFRNYKISVNLGHLRSIQVYVVGEARRPGAYTVSSLSTVLNALFVSGGPDVQGSLRHIQVRRGVQTLPEFDLYDLLLRGDKSKDVKLETGDIIFVPAAASQVVLGGSVRHPAIYELQKDSTLADVLELAGGFSATASTTQISLERIEDNRVRQALNVTLDSVGRRMLLRDGDVLYAEHITAGYEKSVTIRGNLANPGRFAWHEGMRLSEIIPDRMSLLTSDYWRERNRLGVPVPLFESTRNSDRNFMRNLPGQTNDRSSSNTSNYSTQLDQFGVPQDLTRTYPENQLDRTEQVVAPAQAGLLAPSNAAGERSDSNPDNRARNQPGTTPGTMASQQQSQSDGFDETPNAQNRIRIPAAEIDWSYAVIERLDPGTLKSSLVPFNLGRLVQDHDPTQNLELRPGDVVTIVSQNDVLVPQDAQTKYVRLEGEFVASGVYSAGPNDTLDDLVLKAGGLTAKAYLYGSSFNRESSRVFQQQRLDEYISTLSADMERSAAVRAASSTTGILDPNSLAEQRSLVAQLRQMRATGRVVLEFTPSSVGASIPKIPLENGDVFRVPSKPNTVNVIGAVYGQNVFLYDSGRKLEDYIALAGNPNRIADRKHAFIIRADGSILSRERASSVLSNHFDRAQINPGDSIVIPEKLIKPNALRELIDYSQVLSSFGLAAAAINVIK